MGGVVWCLLSRARYTLSGVALPQWLCDTRVEVACSIALPKQKCYGIAGLRCSRCNADVCRSAAQRSNPHLFVACLAHLPSTRILQTLGAAGPEDKDGEMIASLVNKGALDIIAKVRLSYEFCVLLCDLSFFITVYDGLRHLSRLALQDFSALCRGMKKSRADLTVVRDIPSRGIHAPLPCPFPSVYIYVFHGKRTQKT